MPRWRDLRDLCLGHPKALSVPCLGWGLHALCESSIFRGSARFFSPSMLPSLRYILVPQCPMVRTLRKHGDLEVPPPPWRWCCLDDCAPSVCHSTGANSASLAWKKILVGQTGPRMSLNASKHVFTCICTFAKGEPVFPFSIGPCLILWLWGLLPIGVARLEKCMYRSY